MPKRTHDYDTWLFQQLTDPTVAANYINAAIEDSTEMLLVALRNVAETHKMAKIAKKAGIAREALYKTLSEEGNPRLETLRGVLSAMGLRINVAPAEPTFSFVEVPHQQITNSQTTVDKRGRSTVVRKKRLQPVAELGVVKNAIVHPPHIPPINGWLYGTPHTIIGPVPADFRIRHRIDEDQNMKILKQPATDLATFH